MPRKVISRRPGYHRFTDTNMKHMAWCIRNGIGVAITPDWSHSSNWLVEITIKDKLSKDPKTYTAAEADAKRWEYYEYYYKKYKK
jgi:hypothetical protein|tara:strand:+ start:196 stop:450 length:255 start_codon:yes stop_codon:yes gene_type:complete